MILFNFLKTQVHYKIEDSQLRRLQRDTSSDVDQASNIGYIPLGRSCQCGRLEIVRLLLQQPNIDVNKSPEGLSPLVIAKHGT